MAETIVLDPSAIATGRTELDITSVVAVEGVNWGDAEIQSYMSDQAVGSSPIDFRLPNRQIEIPLRLQAVGATSFSTMRANLQAKVGLFQREGGWILRQVGATPLYADVVNATLHLGGSWLQAYRDVDVEAVLRLEVLPDFYGAEVTLDSITATGEISAKLQQSSSDAVIAGNHPARCRMIVTNSGVAKRAVLWAFDSRHYSSVSTAARIFEAEALTVSSGASIVTITGAYGGGSNNAVRLTKTYTDWSNVVESATFSHIGAYRVWVRVYTTSATLPRVRFAWHPSGDTTVYPVYNAPISVPAINNWYMLDLGVIQIDPVAVGSQTWYGRVQGDADGSSNLAVDQIYFQPLDDSAGLAANPGPGDTGYLLRAGTAQAEIRTEGVYAQSTAGAATWGKGAAIAGDLPRLPVSGIEGRAVAAFLRPSVSGMTGGTVADSASESVTLQVKYRPCYLYAS